jgi:putative DNA-invertase from lambdoid prophage Rac
LPHDICESSCGKNKCFKTLESYGVEIKSYTQPYLDTSNSSIRELLLAFFSYIANFQLKRYSEDIKSGQKRALAQGKRIGRPKISNGTKELIADLKSKNISNRNIARELQISEKTVRNYLIVQTNFR